MTLDKFIDHLTHLRDQFDAGKYIVKIDTFYWNYGVCDGERSMDELTPSNYQLNLSEKTLEIHANDE